MANPTLTVEVAFGYDSLDDSPSWTDISTFVKVDPPVRISRGRGSERSAFTAGRATLVLNNHDRRFDPQYSSGPYYGDLKPGVQIRIVATHSAVDYEMFTGWVTAWPQHLSGAGTNSTVTLECVDALAWLNRARLPEDIVSDVIDSFTSPVAALRDTDDYLWQDDVGAYSASMVFGIRQQGASIAKGSSSPSIQFNGLTMWRTATRIGARFPGSVSFWIQTSQRPNQTETAGVTDPGAAVGILGEAIASTGSVELAGFGVYIDAAGRLYWDDTASVGAGSLTSAQVIADGKPHHVVLTASASDISRMYIDGAEAPLAGFTGAVSPRVGLDAIGNASAGAAGADYYNMQFFQGSIQDVAFWDSALTVFQVQSLYLTTLGIVEEAAVTRANRGLDDLGWPAGWRDISTTLRARCGKLVYDGRTGLDFMQEIERTEQGYLFAAKDGKVTLRSRYWSQEDARGNTSQATFSDDGAATAIRFSHNFGFRYDDRDIRNDVVVIAEELGRGRATDLTSAATYGAQALQISNVLTSSQSAADMAGGIVYRYGSPSWRSEPMQVFPGRAGQPATAWSKLLGLELADRITQEITPMGVGSQIAKDMLVGRIEWIVGAVWELSILGEPVPPNFFMLDSSSLDGPDYLGF